jgi:hypothetical protein
MPQPVTMTNLKTGWIADVYMPVSTRPFRSMGIRAAIAILCFAHMYAEEDFTPPRAYPIERYRATWDKNPFTIKTVPLVAPVGSFAQDLVLASMYRISGETVVIVANTKTRERIRLRNDEPAPNGMKVKAVFIEDMRKNSHAELVLGDETVVLHFQRQAIKQMAAQQASEKLVESLVNKQPDAMPVNASPIDLAATVSSVPSGRRARLVIPASQ